MKLLLAIDSSEYSDAAVNAIASRPWPPGTRARVLSAVDTFVPATPALWYDAAGSFESVRDDISNLKHALVTRAAESLRASGLEVETAVRAGDPRSVIVDEAKDWDADLIVVGSRGFTGLKRFFLGSVAQSVVSHAPCSVEVVRVKEEADG